MNNNNEINQKRLIVRYLNGTPIYPFPDLYDKLKEAIKYIKEGVMISNLIKTNYHGIDYGINLESTWFQLIKEVFDVFEKFPEGKVEREKVVLSLMEAICFFKEDYKNWHLVKEKILKNIDVLSGWNQRYYSNFYKTFPLIEQDGKYYIYINGQICEIASSRTKEKEEKWGFITESCTRTYGSIQLLLKFISLVYICLDFQSNPEKYPSSMLIVLPESNNMPSFLHWHWHVKWPYRPKPINWRPNNNLCDHNWLASDLISSFSEQEGIPDKELNPAEWKGQEEEWRVEFGKYPGQLEFAIDTPLRFGEVEEIWFDYGGKTLRWINQTENRHALLIVPVLNRNNDMDEYKLAMRFLSYLTFNTDIPINVINFIGCHSRYYPMLHQPKIIGGIEYPCDYNIHIKYPEFTSYKQNLAYAFYKEGLSSSSIYYSFLSYYKIIQLAFNEDKNKIISWVNNNIDKIRYPKSLDRIKEIKIANCDLADYLYKSCRCAIAHVKNKPIVDPDNPEDTIRLKKDLPIVKELARYAIKSGLFNEKDKN
jgi:hypothetical protein